MSESGDRQEGARRVRLADAPDLPRDARPPKSKGDVGILAPDVEEAGTAERQLSELERRELDLLDELMSRQPTVEQLVAFSRKSETLKLPSLEEDPQSFVSTR